MNQKEEFASSVNKVVDNMNRLLGRLTLDESRRLLTEFFGDASTFILRGEDYNAAEFIFTAEGLESYGTYFASNLPYDKYISQQRVAANRS